MKRPHRFIRALGGFSLIALMFVGLILLVSQIQTPVVHVSHSSFHDNGSIDESCTMVFPPNQWDCDNLPPRFELVWVK